MWIFCPLCGALYTDETTTHMDWHAALEERLGAPGPTTPGTQPTDPTEEP